MEFKKAKEMKKNNQILDKLYYNTIPSTMPENNLKTKQSINY